VTVVPTAVRHEEQEVVAVEELEANPEELELVPVVCDGKETFR
jgi:hypothetical protein